MSVGTYNITLNIPATEGHIPVSGGTLNYRLAGNPEADRIIVFENGWSGSFPYAHWLEQALAPHARTLSYDRAGIGGSRSSAPLSAARITADLAELLGALKIVTPVVIVGHSYGGLIGALHAVQSPQLVERIVQVDPTSELDDPLIDGPLRSTPLLARVLQLCALLGVPGPLEKQAAAHLPPEVIQRLKRPRREQVRSLHWAIQEIRLLPEIRRVIAAGGYAPNTRRLVISADANLRAENGVAKYLVSDDRAIRHQRAFQALHQRQAAHNAGSRWIALPYDHLGLVTRRDAANAVAACILDFL